MLSNATLIERTLSLKCENGSFATLCVKSRRGRGLLLAKESRPPAAGIFGTSPKSFFGKSPVWLLGILPSCFFGGSDVAISGTRPMHSRPKRSSMSRGRLKVRSELRSTSE